MSKIPSIELPPTPPPIPNPIYEPVSPRIEASSVQLKVCIELQESNVEGIYTEVQFSLGVKPLSISKRHYSRF